MTAPTKSKNSKQAIPQSMPIQSAPASINSEPGDHHVYEDHVCIVSGLGSDSQVEDHNLSDPHTDHILDLGTNLEQAIVAPAPRLVAPAPNNSQVESHSICALQSSSAPDLGTDSKQAIPAPVTTTAALASINSQVADQSDGDTHKGTVSDLGINSEPEDQVNGDPHKQTVFGFGPHQVVLGVAADALNDIEGMRIATKNRIASIKADGLENYREYQDLLLMLESIKAIEKVAIANVERSLRTHPLGDWIKNTQGVGPKQGARLLACIGDPYWNTLHNRPRTVSELWAYCGYAPVDGEARRHKRGEKANWSADARVRAFLIAGSCMKNRQSPYRVVYDEARVKYADALHQHPCVRCGPKGKPAQIGSPLSLGHQNARALRMIAKEVLKDLWRASRDVHLAEQTK